MGVHHRVSTPSSAAGVVRVVAALEDPDPRVAGAGFAQLRAAGIDVTVGVGARSGDPDAGALSASSAYRPSVRDRQSRVEHRRTGRRRRRNVTLADRRRRTRRRARTARRLPGGHRRCRHRDRRPAAASPCAVSSTRRTLRRHACSSTRRAASRPTGPLFDRAARADTGRHHPPCGRGGGRRVASRRRESRTGRSGRRRRRRRSRRDARAART